MEKNTYKAIIFDLGGVLLNLDYSRTTKAFQAINPTVGDFDAVYSNLLNRRFFEEYETGHISSSQFRNEIRKMLNANVDDQIIDAAWDAMLLDFPVERIQLLEHLKKRYRLFLLSNTNEIHIAAYSKSLKKAFGFENLSHIFEKEYYSFQMGMRKPNPEIFEFVLKENNLNPAETLFIDDSAQHVEGARSIGIQTIWLEKGKTINEIFKTYLTSN